MANTITKPEWVALLDAEWGTKLEEYDQVSSIQFMGTKTHYSKPWQLIITGAANPSNTPHGQIGSISNIEINGNKATLTKEHSYGESIIVLEFEPVMSLVTTSYIKNAVLENFFMAIMEDIRTTPNFAESLELVGVTPDNTDEEIATALANYTYREYIYNPPSSDIANAEVKFNYEIEDNLLSLSFDVVSGDTVFNVLQPVISVTPNDNNFYDRWQGFTEYGKTATITTDYRVRGYDVGHILIETEDEANLAISFICKVKDPEDDTIYSFSHKETIDMTGLLDIYDYIGLNE